MLGPYQNKKRLAGHRDVLLLVFENYPVLFKCFVFDAPVELAEIMLKRNDGMVGTKAIIPLHRVKVNPLGDEKVAERHVVYQVATQSALLLQKQAYNVHAHQNTGPAWVPDFQLVRHCRSESQPRFPSDPRQKVDKCPESGHVCPQEVVSVVAAELVSYDVFSALDGTPQRCWIIIVFPREDDGVAARAHRGLCHFRALARKVDFHAKMSNLRADHAPKTSLRVVHVSTPTGEHNYEEFCLWKSQEVDALPLAVASDISVF